MRRFRLVPWLLVCAVAIALAAPAMALGIPSGNNITGTVTDGVTGIEGVSIYAYKWDGASWTWTGVEFLTDINGFYDTGYLVAGAYKLDFATFGAYEYEWYDNALTAETATAVTVTDGMTTANINVVLEEIIVPSTNNITGTVTDGVAGIEGVSVGVYSWNGADWLWVGTECYTDIEGSYDTGYLDAGTYRIDFYHPDYEVECYDNVPTVGEGTDVNVTDGMTTSNINAVLAEVSATNNITGTVTDGVTGIKDRSIYVYTFDGLEWAWTGIEVFTGIDGTFDTGYLDAGTYRIDFYSYDDLYVYEFYDNAPNVDAATDIVVVDGETTSNIDAVLQTYSVGTTENITGTVTSDGVTGIAGAEVYVHEFDGESWVWTGLSTSTSADGSYNTGTLPLGTYRVEFYHPEYVGEYYDDVITIDEATDVVVSEGLTESGIDAVLEPAPVPTGGITGTVTDGDGSPLADISVHLYSPAGLGWEWLYSVDTTASGGYELSGLPAGTYRIAFQDMSGGYSYEFYTDAIALEQAADILVTDAVVEGIDAQLASAGHISGTVTDVAGAPVADMQVIAIRWIDADTGWQWIMGDMTDESGSYDIGGLPAGTYHIYFEDFWAGMYLSEYYDNAADDLSATDIELTAGENTTGIDVVLGVVFAARDSYEAFEDTELLVPAEEGVLVNDVDREDDPLEASLVDDAVHGTVDLSPDGSFTYTPDADYSGADTFTYAASDGATSSPDAATVTINVVPSVIPISGGTRFQTAVKTSEEAYPEGLDPAGARTVVIATARNWPDALGGSSLAGVLDGPILLVDTTSVPGDVTAEITRLDATNAIILGGTGAVAESVADALELQLGDGNVDRIAGDSRYDTADQIAERVITLQGPGYDGTAFVATGGKFPDALGAAPLAAANGWPLYLVNPSTGLSADTEAAMADVESVLVLGGTSAVSADVYDDLQGAFASIERLTGEDRYDTAVNIAEWGVANANLGWNRVALATGANFPDALAGGVLQGKVGSVMLLTRPEALNEYAEAALSANKADISSVTYFGGLGALPQVVRDQVAAAIAIDG